MDDSLVSTACLQQSDIAQERDDLAESLSVHRQFVLRTVNGMTDAQAASHPTVSQLCLGGIIKHLTAVEKGWVDFIFQGPEALAPEGDWDMDKYLQGFQMVGDETLAGLLQAYDQVGRRSLEVVRSLPSLDVAQPLPEAPWFPKGATRSARRVFIHIIAETAQHAGHADIIREAIDGAKTMG